jgi:outer membrane immunogenic protein
LRPEAGKLAKAILFRVVESFMKKIILGLAAFAAIGTAPALAADLPAQVYTKAPLIAAIYDWTGFYVGGNVGFSWGRSNDSSTLTNGFGTVLFTNGNNANLDGVSGGGQVGYNWQVKKWVLGLEGDIQWAGEKGSRLFTCATGVCSAGIPTGIILPNGIIVVSPGPAVPASMSQQINWFGTVRGRAGVLVDPKVLLYATGGLAYGEIRTSENVGAVPITFSSTTTNVGWTIGAGIEGALGGNWTAKLEYLFVDLGKASGTYPTPFAAFGGGLLSSNFSSHITQSLLRVGANYKFGGPVVATY